MANRTATVERATGETKVKVTLDLDGAGKCSCDTGIGFLDHLIDGFARHGLFDLTVKCTGDLMVDSHHSAEDVAIVLGEALRQALGDKKGIKRYGFFHLPMDDALILCAVDLSGRAWCDSDLTFSASRIGDLDTEMIGHFFHTLASTAGMNLHFVHTRGTNNHHVAEAGFKALAKALDMATQPEPRAPGVWSTKGAL